MPSRAEQRVWGEWALRALVIAVLALSLWRALSASQHSDATLSATSSTIDDALHRALTTTGVDQVALSLTTTPTRQQRDALVALRRSGMSVRWSGAVSPVALEVTRDRDPSEGARIRVAAAGKAIVVTDSAGALDTLRNGAATLDVGTVVGAVRATDSLTIAVAATPNATARRAVLVLGRADWESKFVMSALTETGWQVRARIPAAPGVDVHDDAILPIDTSRYDAVIALDSSATDLAANIARFVQQGGGLVASTSALGVAGLRAVAPAGVAARIPGRILLSDDTVTRRDLPITPLTAVRADAIPLERQNNGIALAARRAGLGRVLAVGYDESWRWRMLGGVSGLPAHRDWWSRAVASVSPERADVTPGGIDAAPRVAVYSALGEPSTLTSSAPAPRGNELPLALLVLVSVAALAEIASRRFRGAR